MIISNISNDNDEIEKKKKIVCTFVKVRIQNLESNLNSSLNDIKLNNFFY